jgi:hypothetical protein
MLPFLEDLLEKKLSEVLGAEVSFDRVKLSPLSGKLEVLNLAAIAPGESQAFLTIARIEAKIAMARALKQEIAIQSLRVERPSIRLPLSLPSRPMPDSRGKKDAAAKPWQFEADDVLIVDAAVRYEGDACRAVAENATLSLRREIGQIVLTLMAGSVRRISPDVELGALNLTGEIATRDFTQLMTSSATAEGSLGDQLRVQAKTESVQSKTIDARIEGDLDSQLFARLIDPIKLPAITASIHLDIEGTFSPKKIVLRRGEISTHNATMDLEFPR